LEEIFISAVVFQAVVSRVDCRLCFWLILMSELQLL